MKKSISLLIGGVQGEGIISTGINLMKALSSLGYYTYGGRSFSSRIKGGNTSITVHIGIECKMWINDEVDIIFAFDNDTIYKYAHLIHKNGLIFYDSILTPELHRNDKDNIKFVPLPISEMAKNNGVEIIKNTCAMGFLGYLLGITRETLHEVTIKRFKQKGLEIIKNNINVLKDVYQYSEKNLKAYNTFTLTPTSIVKRPLMTGNDAISLGALMAGCRFIASYPITPASEIMENLGKLLPKYGGTMIQVEDEIAAVNMIIGGSYGGVRSMTATSGPGISLMMEGIGLAGMTETPIVIINSQRVGPSTGLPTKHEQSDLFTLYFGGHGEYPSIILTPSTVEECFNATIRGFNLAETYQCPVIILSDLALSLTPQTIEALDFSKVEINRGKIYTPTESDEYKRYQLTNDYISYRALPGTRGGIHHTTGLEHNEMGLPTDDPLNRKKMMNKRFKKIEPLQLGEEIIIHKNNSHVLVLSFGSTYGVIKGAMKSIKTPVDFGFIQMIKPLPIKQLQGIIESYKHIIIVENNYCKQFATILKSELGNHDKIHSLIKYDGTPFTLKEIITEIGGWVN